MFLGDLQKYYLPIILVTIYPVQALSAAPCRLLGQELVLDKNIGGKNGLSEDSDIGYVVGGAKVLYPKSYTGVISMNLEFISPYLLSSPALFVQDINNRAAQNN